MGSVQLYREGRVARLVFDNRPHNSITTEMFAQLGEHVAALDADPSIGAVVIHGAGTHLYTVGADIREMEVRCQLPDRAAATREWLMPINAVLHAIERSPKVYICAMKGISFGGGLETAAACDIRVAADNARLALPEVKLGIHPGYGGSQRLIRLIGMGHTLALVLGACEIDAETARLWGLVDYVTPAGEAETTAVRLATEIAAYAPLALAAAKQAIRQGADVALPTGLDLERESFITCATSADFDEGIRAFIERRTPVFSGR